MSEYPSEFIEINDKYIPALEDGADIAFQLSNLPEKKLTEKAKEHALGEAPTNTVEAFPTTPDAWVSYYSQLVKYMRAKEAGTLPVAPASVTSQSLAKAAFSQQDKDNYERAA